jgi:hypothetical protein
MGTSTLRYSQLSLSVKYSSVLFPFEPIQFLRALSKQGFILPESVGGPVPLGMRAEFSGIVGRKGEVSARLDAARQILGVHAPEVKSAVTEMDLLESLIKTEFSLDSSSLAQYYELLASLTVKAKKNPLECWQTHSAQLPIIEKAAQVIGMEVSLFGVMLTPKGEDPNRADWLDIRIQPLIQSARDHHNVEVVFRRSRRDEVFAFARKLDNTLSNLLALVEKG